MAHTGVGCMVHTGVGAMRVTGEGCWLRVACSLFLKTGAQPRWAGLLACKLPQSLDPSLQKRVLKGESSRRLGRPLARKLPSLHKQASLLTLLLLLPLEEEEEEEEEEGEEEEVVVHIKRECLFFKTRTEATMHEDQATMQQDRALAGTLTSSPRRHRVLPPPRTPLDGAFWGPGQVLGHGRRHDGRDGGLLRIRPLARRSLSSSPHQQRASGNPFVPLPAACLRLCLAYLPRVCACASPTCEALVKHALLLLVPLPSSLLSRVLTHTQTYTRLFRGAGRRGHMQRRHSRPALCPLRSGLLSLSPSPSLTPSLPSLSLSLWLVSTKRQAQE